MDIIMLQTIPDETINGGATRQDFIQGACYPVPDAIGQLWIGRGWARAAAARSLGSSPGLSGLSGGSVTGQTRQTRQTSSTKE